MICTFIFFYFLNYERNEEMEQHSERETMQEREKYRIFELKLNEIYMRGEHVTVKKLHK